MSGVRFRSKAVGPGMGTLWGALLASSTLLGSPGAFASPRWSLALPTGEGDAVSLEDQRPVIERALGVEMQDTTIRGRDEEPEDSVFLLIAVERGASGILIRVWDRGDLAGSRLVSATGSPTVVSRRIALAVSALSRELSRRRELEFRRKQWRETRAAEEAAQDEVRAEQERPRLESGFSAAVMPEHGYLMGPGLRLSLSGDYPLVVRLGLGQRFGAVSSLQNVPWSAIDMDLLVAHRFVLGRDVDWTLGVQSHLLWLQASRISFDHLPQQHQSHTVTLGLASSISVRLSARVRGYLEWEAAALLRSVALGSSAAERAPSDRLQGAYFGVTLGSELTLP